MKVRKRRNRMPWALVYALLLVIVLVTASISAFAEQPEQAGDIVVNCNSSERSGLSVTVYSGSLALVKDSRKVSLPAGRVQLRCADFPRTIDTGSVMVRFSSKSPEPTVLEQLYEYDVITPQSLLKAHVGKKVMLVERSKETLEEKRTEATLLSYGSENVYRIGKDVYLGHPGIVTFPDLKSSLRLSPALGWVVEASDATSQEVEISYLAEGLSWNADYNILLGEDDSINEMSAWITIDNQCGTDFPEAQVSVVAGEPARKRKAPPVKTRDVTMMMAKAAPAEAQAVQEQPLFEYHFYPLPRPVSLFTNQIRQVAFFTARNVKARKELIFRSPRFWGRGPYGQVDRQKATVEIIFKNSKENGLGTPLPAGLVRMYKQAGQEGLQFVGEDSLDHTPEGAEAKLTAGMAFDVEMERKQQSYEMLSKDLIQETWEIQLKNYKKNEVQVRVFEPMYGDWKIAKSNREWKRYDAQTIEFSVPIQAGGVSVISYTAVFKR